mmetsp:Transcript_40084/g.63011  ORF Transcript_40084/g.63011 Transcript_40084/m.63011 type:complete len:324 (+) Transcript_40084:39-1010(+)
MNSMMSAWFLTLLAHVATATREDGENALLQTQSSFMLAPRVAVYLQVGTNDEEIWGEMYTCISNVAKSHTRQVDVYLSTVVDNHEKTNFYYQNLSDVDGVSKVMVQELKNRGADVGQFFQQLLATDIGGYQAVLKIHTKTKRYWRQYMLESLCGTANTAKAAIEYFQTHPEVGIIGPSTLTQFRRDSTYSYGSFFCELLECGPGDDNRPIFGVHMDSLTWCWKVMTNSDELPPAEIWTIIAGDMFWVRGACLNTQRFFRSIPTLINNMTEGYVEGSFGKPEHAMERWIPTLVRLDGWTVADMARKASKTASKTNASFVQFSRY